jgi:hypothetical protein
MGQLRDRPVLWVSTVTAKKRSAAAGHGAVQQTRSGLIGLSFDDVKLAVK